MDKRLSVTQSWVKEYVCPVHGDIGNQTLGSSIPGFEMHLCLRCYLEKLVELGVPKVQAKNMPFATAVEQYEAKLKEKNT